MLKIKLTDQIPKRYLSLHVLGTCHMTQTRFCRNNWKPKGKNTYTRRTFFLTLWLSVNLGVQEKGCIKTYNWFCWHAYAMDKKIASSVSLRWYQIGQNTWHYLDFLHYFLQCVFWGYFVGNGTSNASQLSRNKIQEEGGTGGTCNCIIIFFSQPNFLTK